MKPFRMPHIALLVAIVVLVMIGNTGCLGWFLRVPKMTLLFVNTGESSLYDVTLGVPPHLCIEDPTRPVPPEKRFLVLPAIDEVPPRSSVEIVDIPYGMLGTSIRVEWKDEVGEFHQQTASLDVFFSQSMLYEEFVVILTPEREVLVSSGRQN